MHSIILKPLYHRNQESIAIYYKHEAEHTLHKGVAWSFWYKNHWTVFARKQETIGECGKPFWWSNEKRRYWMVKRI